MDFVRLAVREVRRNGSRTSIGIAAMAPATVILVLSTLVPQGYMRYEAAAERLPDIAQLLHDSPVYAFSSPPWAK